MNKRERVYAAMQGRPVDRLPISMWRHFHKQDQEPDQLAQATLDFYRRYDLDLIKVTPSGLYAIEDWGAAIRYSNDDNTPHRLRRPVVDDPEDLSVFSLPGSRARDTGRSTCSARAPE